MGSSQLLIGLAGPVVIDQEKKIWTQNAASVDKVMIPGMAGTMKDDLLNRNRTYRVMPPVRQTSLFVVSIYPAPLLQYMLTLFACRQLRCEGDPSSSCDNI